MDSIRIAAVSIESPYGAIEKNMDTIERWAWKLRNDGVQIACFPEMSVTGYHLSDDADKFTGSIPGRITEHLEYIARMTKMAIIAGLAEVTSRGLYISQVVATPDRYEGEYRKIHLSPEEKNYFYGGKELPVFHWQGFRFGIGLCYDAHFPEIASIYALKGADIVFFAHASPRPESAEDKMKRWMRYLPARAYDNSIYVAACNQAGTNGKGLYFQGVSLIINPKGIPVATECGDGECAAVAELKREELNSVRGSATGYFMKGRVPSLYNEIVKKRE